MLLSMSYYSVFYRVVSSKLDKYLEKKYINISNNLKYIINFGYYLYSYRFSLCKDYLLYNLLFNIIKFFIFIKY